MEVVNTRCFVRDSASSPDGAPTLWWKVLTFLVRFVVDSPFVFGLSHGRVAGGGAQPAFDQGGGARRVLLDACGKGGGLVEQVLVA